MPKLVEINVSRSIGGAVQIVEFGKVKSDFHLSESERWDVQDLKTDEEVEAFRQERGKILLDRLEELATNEYKWRYEWRDRELAAGE